MYLVTVWSQETNTLILILLIDVQQFRFSNCILRVSLVARRREFCERWRTQKRRNWNRSREIFNFFVGKHHEANARYLPEDIYFNSLRPSSHHQKNLALWFLLVLVKQKINEPRFFFLHFREKRVWKQFSFWACFWETRQKPFEFQWMRNFYFPRI